MKSVTANFKLFICLTLAFILAGMAILGFFGFGKSVDFANTYEIVVSVDQDDKDNSASKIKEYTEEYIEKEGVSDKQYAYQAMDEGCIHVYKFDTKPSIEQEALKTYLEDKFNNDKVYIDVKVSEIVASTNNQTIKLAIALAIVAVAVLVYLAIVEKFASALSVVFTSIVSTLSVVAMIALLRIPAKPFIGVIISFAFVLSAIFATVMVNRFKEDYKNTANEGLSAKEIVDKSSIASIKRILFLFLAVLVVAIFFGAIARGYFIFLALQILLADVCSVLVAFYATPTLWSALKTKKKGYTK